MAAMARDNTMVVTAKEGISFLQKEGADDLIKLQGLDGAKNGEAAAGSSSQTAAEPAADKALPMETDAPPLTQHRTIVETTKEAEQVLSGETLGETRATTEQLKTAVASSSPPQKSRTMVETAKIGQALLGAEAQLIGETRKQTAETKKITEEEEKPAEKLAEPEKPAEMEVVKGKEPEAPAESQAGEEEKKSPAKKSPPKKSPAKEKPSPAAKKEKAKKEAEEKEAEEKAAKEKSPRKKGGRPSLVDQLVQEAQKFAGNSAGDVSEGRVTRRSSKGPEPAAASPAKRPRQAKEKSKAIEPDDHNSNDEADD